MSKFINVEVTFFLASVVWGVVLLVIYDCLRILRKVIKHGEVWIAIEDIIYWMISSVLIFRMMYQQNDGIIRGFSILGIVLGMVMYKYSISEYVVKGISFVLIKIKKLVRFMIHTILRPLIFLKKKMICFVRFIGRILSKRVSCMKHFFKNKVQKVAQALKRKRKRVTINENESDENEENISL